jgi:hypothetical protein
MNLTVSARPAVTCSPVRRHRAAGPPPAASALLRPASSAAVTTSAGEPQTRDSSTPATPQPSALVATRREQLLAILAGGALSALLDLSAPHSALAEGEVDAQGATEALSASPATRALGAIRRDFVDRQYYVTGDVSPELFAPDCLFKDPTVEVVGGCWKEHGPSRPCPERRSAVGGWVGGWVRQDPPCGLQRQRRSGTW